ncbi:MAG TPA: AMP-binding protein, partial [Streptosporangiaceae bacterium]|nr:AMP-binding protein [Streptosporangiaceae bacterium]
MRVGSISYERTGHEVRKCAACAYNQAHSLGEAETEMVLYLAALPDERAASDPGGPCLADGRRELDNASFASEVRRVSSVLAQMGIGRGDVVAVMLPNSVELVTIMFAAWRLGAALTPVNPALTSH